MWSGDWVGFLETSLPARLSPLRPFSVVAGSGDWVGFLETSLPARLSPLHLFLRRDASDCDLVIVMFALG